MHNVKFNIPLKSEEFTQLKNALSPSLAEKLETYKEIAIMHEVLNQEGENIQEKADNLINKVQEIKIKQNSSVFKTDVELENIML